ncbi:MAG: hypothetical protein AAF518_28170, partial [Spirochaetota bacterium]
SCSSDQQRFPKPKYLHDNIVVYQYDIGNWQKERWDISNEDWIFLFENLYRETRTVTARGKTPLLDDVEVRLFLDAFQAIPEKEKVGKYSVLIKREDTLNPHFAYYRTAILVWIHENEIFLLFPEIYKYFYHDNGYLFTDWGRFDNYLTICEFNQKIIVDKNIESFGEYFSEKSCDEQRTTLWDWFWGAEEEKSLFAKRHGFHISKRVLRERRAFTAKQKGKVRHKFVDRLESLELIYKKGLITEKEYLQKKQQILDDL